MNTDKIGEFLSKLNDAEFIYLRQCIELVALLKELTNGYKLTKEQICEYFKIAPGQYNKFINGNYEYGLRDMARINSLFVELASNQLEPIKIKK